MRVYDGEVPYSTAKRTAAVEYLANICGGESALSAQIICEVAADRHNERHHRVGQRRQYSTLQCEHTLRSLVLVCLSNVKPRYTSNKYPRRMLSIKKANHFIITFILS